jgi:hypothetical protein
MRYLEIKPKLFLVEQPVEKKKATSRPSQLNHIWIYDRSGSMSWTLDQLAKDLIARAKQIPVGDTLTLGWFSSEGEHNFMLKGYKITGPEDQKILADTINKNKHSLGTTCFSEILTDTDQVIKDLSNISPNFSLCFFTDGCPVVSNYHREIESIYEAIKKINSKLTATLLVGYGNYYNKQLMSDMAERLGGSLTHSENLGAFSVQLEAFIEGSHNNGSKIEVDLETPVAKDGFVFGINGNQINMFLPTEKGSVQFTPSAGSEDDTLYLLTDKIPAGGSQKVTLTENELRRPTHREPLIRGAYAAAYLLTQRTKTDLALEVLSVLGDKALLETVNNAFTNTEYGRAEAKIAEAATNPKKRFEEGYIKNYLPAANAFCLLDAMRTLMSDDEAYFYPYHFAFEYQRIGVASIPKAGFPKFTAKPHAKCPLNKLSWNKSMLNRIFKCSKASGFFIGRFFRSPSTRRCDRWRT